MFQRLVKCFSTDTFGASRTTLINYSNSFYLVIGKHADFATGPISAEKVHMYLYLISSFRKQMLQGAKFDLFNPLALKAQNSECQKYCFLCN